MIIANRYAFTRRAIKKEADELSTANHDTEAFLLFLLCPVIVGNSHFLFFLTFINTDLAEIGSVAKKIYNYR
jgi:hypothetical protein